MSEDKRPIKLVEWFAGAVCLVAIGAIAALFFKMRVCDPQLTSSGSTVVVCRHFSMTDPPIVAAGLVVLVCLGFFFTEVSGFGLTLKRDVKEALHTAQRAENNTDALQRRVEDIRSSVRGGPRRTMAMENVMREMVSDLRDHPLSDVDQHLLSDDPERRLTAIAHLYAHPDPRQARRLLDMAVSEERGFNQYWALLAFEKAISGQSGSPDEETRALLHERLNHLAPTSDRAQVIKRLLGSGQRPGS